MSCCTGSQLTFISEDETPLAQTLGGATLGSGDNTEWVWIPGASLSCRAAANWDCSCQDLKNPRCRVGAWWWFPEHPPPPGAHFSPRRPSSFRPERGGGCQG